MADERRTLEDLLGTGLDRASSVRVHRYTAPGDADYEVTYAAVELSDTEAADVRERAGLEAPEAQSFGRAMLPGAWQVEPGDPPAWWPEPSDLGDQAVRPIKPNGWLAVGYKEGTLFVLATRTPSA